MKISTYTTLSVLLCFLIAGCGQIGPLYLPKPNAPPQSSVPKKSTGEQETLEERAPANENPPDTRY